MDWLLEGDPAVRWQVMRDLLDRPEPEWQAERAKVAAEGWGAELLAHQDPQGTWAGSLYHRKWVSTHYTLLLLRSMGLPQEGEAGRRGARLLLDGGIQADGGIRHSNDRKKYVGETCETGMGLAICSYFTPEDLRLAGIVDHLRRVQTPDGGWNCRWVNSSTHGSFHTTISVLEGLYEYGRSFAGRQADVDEMQAKGREFLLDHRLYRSHHTGKTSNAVFTRFSFPPQWHYDVLRGLDHFQAVDAPRDERLADAIELVRSSRQLDGT
jgi:hypothetical protein